MKTTRMLQYVVLAEREASIPSSIFAAGEDIVVWMEVICLAGDQIGGLTISTSSSSRYLPVGLWVSVDRGFCFL